MHKMTKREDSLPTYDEACMDDIQEVRRPRGFEIWSNIFKSKQIHLPVLTKVCDDVSERFRPSIGSLPEEVKWQFQTIQKNPKIHVRASR